MRRRTPAFPPASVLAIVALTMSPAPGMAGPAPPAAAPEAGARAGPDTLTLQEALEEHRHRLTMTGGRLAGPGADLLLREGAAARHLLVGETHGVAEAPRIVADLFRRLVDHGYRHLAVEIGPVQAERLDEVLRGPDPMGGVRAFLRENWPGVPFYSWRGEAELLAAAVEAGARARDPHADGDDGPAGEPAEVGRAGRPADDDGRPGVVWGLDYDILGDRYPLHRLRELAPDAAAGAAADRAAALADSLLEGALETGDLSAVMMFSGSDSVWTALREAYDPRPGSEADRVLEQLEATSRINGAWTRGERWRSNRLRVELIKRNLHRHLDRAAPGAKVMVKMGGYHTMRGLTPNDTYDVGNHLHELAVAGGDESFHLAILGGPGGVHAALLPRGWGVREVPTILEQAEWGDPIAAAVLEEGWTVFDLRPLRPLVSGGRVADVPERVEEMIFAHDAIVVIPGSTAARPLEVVPGE